MHFGHFVGGSISDRRAAAARGDRHGAGLPPAPAAGGRADGGAGRHGADPGAVVRAAAGAKLVQRARTIVPFADGNPGPFCFINCF